VDTISNNRKNIQNCVQGGESVIFTGKKKAHGTRFVTKIMKLRPRANTDTIYEAEQVTRNLLWLGMQEKNQSLAKIHHIRGIEVDGKPALLIVQEHADGTQNRFTKKRIDPNTFKYFDDIVFRPDGYSNIIDTEKGLKVVDARMDEQAMKTQRCLPGKCNCNWHEYVERTAGGFGKIPEGYVLPREIRKAYPANANPWIGQIEKETQQPGLVSRWLGRFGRK